MTVTERRKKFGQVFTPATIASLMADWVMGGSPKRVLDPAFGRGALAAACLNLDRQVKVFGYEVDPIVLEEIPEEVKGASTIKLQDFLEVPTTETFEGIIANPPYLRHRELRDHMPQRSELARIAGCEIPKSANQYVDFLVKATLHLSVGGRAAFLIPAEWMSANFSTGLKEYLLNNNLIHSLVTFSNCSNVFTDALTTASLVLIEKTPRRVDEINSYYLQSIDGASAPQAITQLCSACEPRRVSAAELGRASKWEPILRGDQCTIPDGWIPLGQVALTRRGIATGANEFFLLAKERCVEAQIDPAHVLPCIGRSSDVRGLIFAKEDFDALDARQASVWLLNFAPTLTATEQVYVQEGEAKGFHLRFLTKCRQPWFAMEQRDPAPVWAGVFGRGDLRFVYNEAGVRSLTNFHCIYPKNGGASFAKALVVVLNSRPVRDLMVSHRRGYGGGLMKFEPKDLLTIPVPDLESLDEKTINELAHQLPLMHARECEGIEPSTEMVNAIVARAPATALGNSFRLVG